MLYRTINRNKKSIVLDLQTERGREIVLDLVAHCDVLLENFRPGTLESGAWDRTCSNEANPDLVITRISAFGQTGPLSSARDSPRSPRPFGGMRELVGDPDRPPVRVGVSIGDSIAGLYAAFGTVMALFQRGRVKVPLAQRVIDVALNESGGIGEPGGELGFMFVDVEAGPGEASIAQRVHERVLVDDGPACGVDQDRRRLHRREHGRIDEVSSGGGQWHVQRQEVAGFDEFVPADLTRRVGQPREFVLIDEAARLVDGSRR